MKKTYLQISLYSADILHNNRRNLTVLKCNSKHHQKSRFSTQARKDHASVGNSFECVRTFVRRDFLCAYVVYTVVHAQVNYYT